MSRFLPRTRGPTYECMMDDCGKTRDQLLEELEALRRQVACSQNRDAEGFRVEGISSPYEGEEGEGPKPLGLLQSTFSGAPLIVWAVDRHGVFTLSEGKTLESLGLKPGEIVGHSAFDLYGNQPAVLQSIRRALTGESFVQTLKIGGIYFTCWFSPLRSQQGEILGAAGVAVDITAHKRVEDQLESERQLLQGLVRAQERDRQLTAFEIHDGLVQYSSGALMHLEALSSSAHLDDDSVRAEVETVLGLTRKAVEEARHLIRGLRPPVLDERGVVPAIEYLIDDLPADGPWIEFTADLQSDRLEPLLEGTVYRIVQEAVTNVIRHSKSDRAEVRLTQRTDQIRVEVRDWGVGFDPAGITRRRFGLQGIRARARLLHGRAVIQSSPGDGTRVCVELPIADIPGKTAIINDRSIE